MIGPSNGDLNRRSWSVWTCACECGTFGRSSYTPWLLPTNFLAMQTEPILTKFLLSLVVQLVLKFHLFRICGALISHDSNSALCKLQWRSRDVSEFMDLGFSSWRQSSLGFLCVSSADFGFSWITLNPLRCQVLHYHYISVMQSRFLIFIKNLCGLRL